MAERRRIFEVYRPLIDYFQERAVNPIIPSEEEKLRARGRLRYALKIERSPSCRPPERWHTQWPEEDVPQGVAIDSGKDHGGVTRVT